MIEDRISTYRRIRNFANFQDIFTNAYSVNGSGCHSGHKANCGPLNLAVMAGDEHAVSNLLDRYPAICREVNLFGQTPIHLAVLHPTCLRLIVEESEQSILDHRDIDDTRALDYTAKLGCEESVVILMEQQCSIDLCSFGYTSKCCSTRQRVKESPRSVEGISSKASVRT